MFVLSVTVIRIQEGLVYVMLSFKKKINGDPVTKDSSGTMFEEELWVVKYYDDT